MLDFETDTGGGASTSGGDILEWVVAVLNV